MTQELQKKRMFLEGDSNITNLICLMLAQALYSHCAHQQRIIQSPEIELLQVTHVSNFTDLSASLSGELVKFLVCFVVAISI